MSAWRRNRPAHQGTFARARSRSRDSPAMDGPWPAVPRDGRLPPRCPGRCLGGAGSLAMCNASVMRLLLLPTLPSPVVAAVASVGHGLQTSRARWHWAEAHGEQAHRPTRAMLLVASGSLRVRLVVPITACAAAGPESLLGAAARGDWACVLAAESGHARRAAQVSRAACAIRGAATPKS